MRQRQLLFVECASVLRSAVRAQRLSSLVARAAMETIQGAPIQLVRDADLVPAALGLAMELDHPVYDCLYLALGIRSAAPVLTADRRIASLISAHPVLSGTVTLLAASVS